MRDAADEDDPTMSSVSDLRFSVQNGLGGSVDPGFTADADWDREEVVDE